jgi:hypothetical protein
MYILIFASSFIFYILHMAPSVTVGDAGEFITASAVLGIAHAPGYPLFSLLGKIAVLLVPWGSVAFRVNILSAAAGAAAVAMVYGLIKDNLPPYGRRGDVPTATAAAALFAVSIAVARSAAQTEVFTLNALFVAAMARAILAFIRRYSTCIEPLRAKAFGLLYLAALIFGLAAANHQTAVLLLPATAWLLYPLRREVVKRFAAVAAFALLGFSVNFYLPIRAAAGPPLNVGNPSSPHNFIRVLRRADYGTLKLTAGDKPGYSAEIVAKQAARAVAGVSREFTSAGAVLIAIGAWAVAAGKIAGLSTMTGGFWLIFYLFSVPFFIFMGNLPFNPESEGILERFYVMGNIPLVFLLACGAVTLRNKITQTINREKKLSDVAGAAAVNASSAALYVAAAGLFILAVSNAAARRKEFDWRLNFLAHDYGRNVLKSVATGGVLFMDGGDDTFYTTAYFVNAEKIRGDVSLFDRGGVVFKPPYGDDFRRLSREDKDIRRRFTESGIARTRPVFFSTFNKDVMGAGGVHQTGILYRASDGTPPAVKRSLDGRRETFFAFYSLRNIFDDFGDHRSRALQPIYAFMEATAAADSSESLSGGDKKRASVKAAGILDYSLKRWPDISWLAVNSAIESEQIAYKLFIDGDIDGARRIYEMTVRHNPENYSAWTNLGVVFERMGADGKALECYERAYRANPRHSAAYYNSAVIYWKRGEWKRVAEFFGKVTEIEPANERARGYLEDARKNMR